MNNTQVFLKNERIMNEIIKAASLSGEDIVIEIGSGDGRLTRRIAQKVKKVYAIEKDRNLIDMSKVLLKDFNNVIFLNDDVLKIELPGDANKIVSNLPYAIASPVTEKIVYFLNAKPASMAVLMYQLEFGERMVAYPGLRDYSMLSVFVQYTCESTKIMEVSKSNFRPVPAVDSAVIMLKPRKIDIDEGFLSFCRLIFQHKKKNLYSALIDCRDKLTVKSKDELREKLKGVDESFLKKKVFYFEIKELLNTYNIMLNLGVWEGEK